VAVASRCKAAAGRWAAVVGRWTMVRRWVPVAGSREAVYLTMVYEMKSADAATVLNLFTSTTNLAPLLGVFLSDSYLGCYATLGLASVASFLGMVLLMVTANVSSAAVWLALCGRGCVAGIVRERLPK
jgi:dipeptide/tripeptide permease